jgi:hypothetical protein
MPDGMRREMAANEQFVLAAARVPLPDGVRDDLLAGLDPDRAVAGEPAAPAAWADGLRAELSAHRSLVDVCQGYLGRNPEPNLAGLLRRLADGEQEIIYRLARALRLAGEPPGAVAADPELLRRAMRHESTPDRTRFLRTLTEQATARCQAQIKRAGESNQKVVWEELAGLVQAQARAAAEFAG